MTDRPRILVSRAIFPEVLAQLAQHFDVESNQDDAAWSREEFVRRLQGKQGVLTTGSERVDAELLAACPALQICANMAVGYNNFDVPAMSAAGVLATNAPGVLTETTADMGFALLMAAARRVTEGEHFLRAGAWKRWSYDMLLGQDVHGSTLGIVGMGRIGQGIARRGAHGFGMKVIYHNRSRLPEADEQAVGARYVGLEELLRSADHVVLVLPYTPEAHHLINAERIALMKPGATLINIARGGLIDENALAAALQAGRIAAAGLDVFEGEPQVNPALLACRNVVLTPHIGSATGPTRMAMAQLAADNLIGFLTQGKPVTPLNADSVAHHG
ncbi:D-glycerate dehydrogenase [Ottowia sp. GY511]|uniref:2-hydroxyacid dehydrogenase n=1 Tax=Ottowia flava TaxID=2675430 RepID=A0ABW4KNS8_9BURK|nr:D-glycerate dehydrogenase [Ottowia sp. GY511]TXK28328.1 D-glycerate dehydrogenase [Ottowia sp. GY511]